jgi:hypothetical protein
MENQFSLTGLALLTPEIKELISLGENSDFRNLEKMSIDEMRAQFAQYEKKLIQWEATGVLLPGAREAAAATFETLLAGYESGLKTDNQTALQDAQESDCKTVQDAYNTWLYTARPTPAQALVGAAKMRAEMRAAGIIEASPESAPVGAPVIASSSGRPALAAPPAPTPAVAVGPPLALVPAATPAPAAEQLPRLANALTSRFTLPRLKKWLAEVGLIDPETGTAKPNTKPFEWAAAREALHKAGLLRELSSEHAADVFSEAFATTVSAGTMKNRESNSDKKGKFYRMLTHYKGLLAEFLAR